MISKLIRQPWVFSFAAALAVWLITIAYTGGQGAGAILTAALSFATFTIIVGLGQMMVITTGPGNVDLSIPATITLAGVVAMKVMDEETGRMLLGIVAALGAATLVGIFNYGLIRLLRIPPIIATLSSRVAPGSMAKFPVRLFCSGGLKKRNCTSPRMNSATCVASTSTASASTG
jgi:ribose transport system permease protein